MDSPAHDPRFQDIVSSVEHLEAVIGQPSPRIVAKVTDTIDGLSRDFIAHSPFVLVASSDANGKFDVSPKGDPAGFVRVLDERTLAVPERPGNKRVDTFRNILQNPQVGLIFLVPGKRETLRVSGAATIVRDADLRESMALGGKVPDLALVVSVQEVFIHCTKCIVRSHLWEPASWPSVDGLASLAEFMVAHGKLDITVADMASRIDDDARNRLY
jgi:PPOX class probable FMN-dependent enzyme